MGAVLLGREFVARAHGLFARSARRSCSRPKIPRAHILFFGIAAVLLLDLTVPASAAPFLVGTWFGTGQPNDKSEMWVAHMLPNGDFRAEFRACIKGQAFDANQTGRWSLAGDMETITLITANGQPYTRTDTYKILFQDGKHQTYRYLKTGFVYNSARVDDKFEMPSCESIS
jgi:hypothetical protein